MFFKIIQKLRNKPEGAKRLIALSTSVGITAIIAVFWSMSYIPYASGVLNGNTASVQDALSDFKQIKDRMSDKTPVDDVKNVVDNINEGVAGFADLANQYERNGTNTAGDVGTTSAAYEASSTTTKATSTATTSSKVLIQ